MERQIFTLDKFCSRLDLFLVSKLLVSRNTIRELLTQGKVAVNGKRARGGQNLVPGDIIEVGSFEPNVRASGEHILDALPAGFNVIYEDLDLLVVAKPRKMASVRLRVDEPVTLADCIARHSGSCLEASPDPRESGLVQRLDYFTSGVLIAAKNRLAWELLRKQLFAEKVEKTYLALVEKRPVKSRFTIKFPLIQSRDGKSMLVRKNSVARNTVQLRAITEVTVLGQYEHGGRWFSVVRAKGRRVRRHQIRAHLSSTGHPLVGDRAYEATSELNDAIPWAGGLEQGFLLHAQDIKLQHPSSKRELYFQTSSEYFRRLIGVLEQN